MPGENKAAVLCFAEELINRGNAADADDLLTQDFTGHGAAATALRSPERKKH
jgi:hypothetical protein